jgi:hypothetical protein
MELRFVQPDLRRLDLLLSDVLAIPIGAGERPPQGCAGLVDYRFGGRVSEVIQSGAMRGAVGDKVFLSGRPKLPFDKVLLYGQGELENFNPQIYAGLVDLLLESLSELGVRRAVVELPGRARDLIKPEIAAEILLDRTGDHPLFDSWTLVDSSEAQRTVTNLLRRDRRNDWRLSST